MSNLCDKSVLLFIYDKRLGRLIEYKSDPQFDANQLTKIMDEIKRTVVGDNNGLKTYSLQTFSNEDYDYLTTKHLPRNYKHIIDQKDELRHLDVSSDHGQQIIDKKLDDTR